MPCLLVPVAAAVLSAGALGATAQAEAAEFRRAPTPSWSSPSRSTRRRSPCPDRRSTANFTSCRTCNAARPPCRTTFRRVASRALNGRGVEEIAHVGIDFDPCVPALSLHTLNLHRDGRVQDRLATARIKVLQRETELEYRIYDGGRTLDISLDDVRPGDIVEFAYSVQGGNPMFGGREFGTFDVQWRSPVHRLHRRLRLPVGRDVIRFQAYLTDLRPTRQVKDGWIEYVWQADDVPPLPRQTGTPAGMSRTPASAGGFRRLARGRALGRAVLCGAGPPGRRLARGGRTHRRAGSDAGTAHACRARLRAVAGPLPGHRDRTRLARPAAAGQGARAALRRLQGQGAARGDDAARPGCHGSRRAGQHAPAAGSGRRAAFARRVQSRRPSGAAVRPGVLAGPDARAAEGRPDAARAGELRQALVLDGQSDALVEMPEAVGAERRRDIAMRLDASAGFAHAPTLEVTTTFDGAAAESMRETLRNESTDELQREYLSYYRRSYPTLEIAKPIPWRTTMPPTASSRRRSTAPSRSGRRIRPGKPWRT